MFIGKVFALVTCAFLSLNNSVRCQAVDYGSNKAAGHYYAIRGFRMYAERYGKGVPILMIPGNGGSIGAFNKTIPAFVKTNMVIAADSRSQGNSMDGADSLSFEQMADDYAVLLDSLKLSAANVIGWSDGGIIALLLAIRHPEKVLRLISTGANLWPDSTAIVPAVWKEDHEYYQQHKDIVPKTPGEKNRWKLFLLDWTQPNVALSQLSAIRCPSLIVSGDRDLIVLEHSIAIYRSIPGASLWILPNSGHATLRSYPEEFNAKANAFFLDKMVETGEKH